MKQENRGGPGRGQGRKPGPKTKTVSFRVEPRFIPAIKKVVKDEVIKLNIMDKEKQDKAKLLKDALKELQTICENVDESDRSILGIAIETVKDRLTRLYKEANGSEGMG